MRNVVCIYGIDAATGNKKIKKEKKRNKIKTHKVLFKFLLKRLIRQITISEIPIIKPRGRITHLALDPEFTKFNINDYVKLSKKTRNSETLIDKEKPILQYFMLGKCVFFRRRGLNSSFTLRNLVTLAPFEMSYALFAPSICGYAIIDFFIKELLKLYRRNGRYELRLGQPSKSQAQFFYVMGQIDTTTSWLAENKEFLAVGMDSTELNE